MKMKREQERKGKLTSHNYNPQSAHALWFSLIHNRSNKYFGGNEDEGNKLREMATVTTKFLAKPPFPLRLVLTAAFTRQTKNTVAVINCMPRKIKNWRGRLRLATSSGREPMKIMVTRCSRTKGWIGLEDVRGTKEQKEVILCLLACSKGWGGGGGRGMADWFIERSKKKRRVK